MASSALINLGNTVYGQTVGIIEPPQDLQAYLPTIYFSITSPEDGAILNDDTPTISGTKLIDPNNDVAIYDNNEFIGSTSSETELWSFTPSTPLSNGQHTITAYLFDGCEFDCLQDSISISIDTIPPSPPVISDPPDDYITNNEMPVFVGSAETGSASIEVFDENDKIGQAVSIYECFEGYYSGPQYDTYYSSTLDWCFIPSEPLSEGSHEISASAIDAAGNISPMSNEVVVTIDLTPPVTTASPSGGSYALHRSIVLTANEPAAILYTLDGSMPTEKSERYKEPIVLEDSLTLTFFAVDWAGNAESVKSESYEVAEDETGPEGRIRINSGDDFTEIPIVNVEVTCSDPMSGCRTITLEWDNQELNQRSSSIDTAEDIRVSTESGSRYTFTAFETGPDTGVFTFSFSNDDSFDNYVGFDDGEEIQVEEIRFSSDQRTKWIRVSFEDHAGNIFSDEDRIELVIDEPPGMDTVPPTISPLLPIVREATGSLTILTLEPPAVTDNADPSPEISSDAPARGFPYGTTLVTWTAVDSSDNVATAVQRVTIVEVFINSVSDSTPYWEHDSVFVAGSVEGSEGGEFAVAVEWGDGTVSEGVTIIAGGEWGPVRHSYSADSLRISPDRQIIARLTGEGTMPAAISEPTSIVIQKHPTDIDLVQDPASDRVTGQLTDLLTGDGVSARTIELSLPEGSGTGFEAVTGLDGSFAGEIQQIGSGSMAQARFAGDELYLASFTGQGSPLTISVGTDRQEYREGDEVVASGKVSRLMEDELVNLRITQADGSLIAEAEAAVLPDLSYESRFALSIEGLGQTYQIQAVYAGESSEAAFVYGEINYPPVADAGSDFTIELSLEDPDEYQLDGSSSSDPDGDTLSYQWEQISGPPIQLQDPDSPTPSFTLPPVDSATEVIFRLRVTDGLNDDSTTVKATIVPAIASPDEGNNAIYYAAGGGAAAAAAGITLGVKYYKPKRPKVPLLRWHVFAPQVVQTGGNAYVDVIVNNLGEADGKDIKLAVESAGLDCDPGVTIETLMPFESRKFSFKVKQRRGVLQAGDAVNEIKVSLQSTWSVKKEILPLLMASEIKWNPKKEKVIAIRSRNIRVGLLVPHNIRNRGDTGPQVVQSWLRDRGYQPELMSSIPTNFTQYDAAIVFTSKGQIPPEWISALYELVGQGRGVMILGGLQRDGMLEVPVAGGAELAGQKFKNVFQLLGYVHNGAADGSAAMLITESLGLRITDSKHPITRNLQVGHVYRLAGAREPVTSLPIGSGQAIVEQGFIRGGGGHPDVSIIPAIVANSISHSSQGNGAEGRAVHINFEVSPYFGMSSLLFERSLMWVAHSLGEEIDEGTE